MAWRPASQYKPIDVDTCEADMSHICRNPSHREKIVTYRSEADMSMHMLVAYSLAANTLIRTLVTSSEANLSEKYWLPIARRQACE